jgi:DNA repair exonuclease SbcCD nuclease subunit
MVICSDLIYPAGGTLEYAYKHCWPYRDYPRPIYALPGNHDWYDSLRGFMA